MSNEYGGRKRIGRGKIFNVIAKLRGEGRKERKNERIKQEKRRMEGGGKEEGRRRKGGGKKEGRSQVSDPQEIYYCKLHSPAF